MEREILHVDVNNAFLSWTAVEKLKIEPTIVEEPDKESALMKEEIFAPIPPFIPDICIPIKR